METQTKPLEVVTQELVNDATITKEPAIEMEHPTESPLGVDRQEPSNYTGVT